MDNILNTSFYYTENKRYLKDIFNTLVFGVAYYAADSYTFSLSNLFTILLCPFMKLLMLFKI